MVELLRALGALADPPTPELQRVADLLDLGPLPDEADHTDLFVFQLPPFASIYLGGEGKLGGDAHERVAGFWRAVGLSPPAEADSLGALLGLYANLLEAGASIEDPARATLLRESAAALLCEHLTSWLGAYLQRLSTLAPAFYRGWADLLRAALLEASGELNPGHPLSAHLREAPLLADPRIEGGEAFLDGLLAPVRTGMILTRTDLALAASSMHLGLRAGERRYALEALFAQDARPVLTWLRDQARTWAAHHEAAESLIGPIATTFWIQRASATDALLTELVEMQWEVDPCAP